MRNIFLYLTIFLLCNVSSITPAETVAADAPSAAGESFLPALSPTGRIADQAELIATKADSDGHHLRIYVGRGDVDLVQRWTRYPHLNPNVQDRRGNTGLHYAVDPSTIPLQVLRPTVTGEVVELDAAAPRAPLVSALLRHSGPRSKYLISINLDIANNRGQPPLLLAVQRAIRYNTPDSLEVLDLLLGHWGSGLINPDSITDILNQLVAFCVRRPDAIKRVHGTVCHKLLRAGGNSAAALRMLDRALTNPDLSADHRAALESLRSQLTGRLREALREACADGRLADLASAARTLHGTPARRGGLRGLQGLQRDKRQDAAPAPSAPPSLGSSPGISAAPSTVMLGRPQEGSTDIAGLEE